MTRNIPIRYDANGRIEAEIPIQELQAGDRLWIKSTNEEAYTEIGEVVWFTNGGSYAVVQPPVPADLPMKGK